MPEGIQAQSSRFIRINVFKESLKRPSYVLLTGGTLGLFTGMSLLSIVEMVFWIYKSLMRAVFDTRF